MLSTTHEITDVKSELPGTYLSYGFVDDTAFSAAITKAIETAMYEAMLARISEGQYQSIQILDKTNLDLWQNYVYRAEVFYSCYFFLYKKSQGEYESRSAESESLDVEGYKKTLSGGMSINGLTLAADGFYKKGDYNFSLAGVKTGNVLKRGNSNLSCEESRFGYPPRLT